MKKIPLYREFVKGLWDESPVFRQLLGMCPTLAVTNSAINGMSMGIATSFVLISSSLIVSIIRKIIPPQIRIAVFTVVIATFVTIVDLFLAADFPQISKALGPYVPLIVVNCIILGRQEAFASRNSVHKAFIDALGMGLGFTLSLLVLGTIREIFGFGSIFGINILGTKFENWVIMILPPGAFITLGLLIAIMNLISKSQAKKSACSSCELNKTCKI